MTYERRRGRILRTAGDPPNDYTRADLIATYYENTRQMADDVFWAWEVVTDAVREESVDDAWELVLDLVDAAPDPSSLGNVAAGPLEDLLQARASDLIDRVEAEAPTNPRLREALAGVWVYPRHVGQELCDRIYAAAEKNPGNWPVDESGIPKLAEELLASDDIADRRWGAKQLGHVPYTPRKSALLVELLHSGDEELRETAAQDIAYSQDSALLVALIAELDAHPGVDGGRDLAWSVNWLAQNADAAGQRQAHEALLALAARGDEQSKRHVEELLNPGLAVRRFADSTNAVVAAFEKFVSSGASSSLNEDSLTELRKQRAEIEKLAKA